MNDKKVILQTIIGQGILPLFYWESPSVCVKVIQTLYRAGVRAVEYTNRGTAALDNFTMLKMTLAAEAPDLYLGIGTIKSAAEANAFIKAGADFIVAPIVNPEVAAVADQHKMLWIPGCMTPTEISLAQHYDAALIKIFPANVLGPAYIKAVLDVFRGQLFMPTGGVELTTDNISGWFRAGVSAVGMGSKLITKKILKNKSYDQLYTDTISALQLIQVARQS